MLCKRQFSEKAIPASPAQILFASFLLLTLFVGTSGITAAQVSNNSLNFDGNDHVDGASVNPNLPQGNSPRTIEAWINPRSIQNGTIFNYGNFAFNQRFGLLYIGQRLYLVGEFHDSIGSTIIGTNQWTHVAISYDGSTAVLYVNGEVEIQTPLYFSGPFNTTGFNWRMGSGSGVNYGYELFDGVVDEIKVWNSARTQTQVHFDMLAESCGATNLVAYYNFNQGIAGGNNTSVTSLIDRSLSFADGLFINFELTGLTSNFVEGAPVCPALLNVGQYMSCLAQKTQGLSDQKEIILESTRSTCIRN